MFYSRTRPLRVGGINSDFGRKGNEECGWQAACDGAKFDLVGKLEPVASVNRGKLRFEDFAQHSIRLKDGDWVTESDFSGGEDLGEDALFTVIHQFAETGCDTVHLFAGISGSTDEEDGSADLDLFSGEWDEVDPFGFDIRADDTGREVVVAEGDGVF